MHLFGQYIRQEQTLTLEEGNVGIVVLEPEFLFFGNRAHGAVHEVEIAANTLKNRLEATCAYQFNLGLQGPNNSQLPFQQLGSGPDLERLDLLEFGRMVVHAAGSIALPDAHFTNCQLFDIDKHWLFADFLPARPLYGAVRRCQGSAEILWRLCHPRICQCQKGFASEG